MEPRCRVSFVVTSRNDNHGGGMLHRFGIFTDALIEQADRHGLAGELVVVEWNPPPGPRLHEVLKLRHKSDSFAVRFIEVPPAAHQAIRNSDVIPLFQMIAKNVGIRRARGEFVIATNPDVLFSDALISFLADSDLRRDTMYRLDRHDVAGNVPADASVAEQLAWCARNVLRIHGRWGSLVPKVDRPWRCWWRSCMNRVALLGVLFHRARGWRPWQIQKTLRVVGTLIAGSVLTAGSVLQSIRALWSVSALRSVGAIKALRDDVPWVDRERYGQVPTMFRRVMAHAYIVYGPRHVLRRGVWLGLKKALGLPRIHTNGCGDFTMLARTRWLELRGYPELPLWSMHLDSFLCFMGAASGLRERVLRPPCVMYHLEHGNSWVVMTPEERLRTFALKPWIDTSLLGEVWDNAYWARRPIVLNDERWGLADQNLEEVLLLSGEKQIIKPGSPAMSALEGR